MKWEYEVTYFNESSNGFLSKHLNAMGERGWELVTCDRDLEAKVNPPFNHYFLVFKKMTLD